MKHDSIKKNFFYNTAYQIFTMITPFITSPYTARVLGADGIGLQSYVASIASYFVLIAALGTASYGQREIARNRDDIKSVSEVFWEISLLRLITTLIVMIPWCCMIVLYEEYRPYLLVSTFTVLAGFFDISWLYAGVENFKMVVTRNFFVRVATIVFLFVFVKDQSDLLLYIFAISFSTLAGNVSMWIGLRKYVIRVPFDYRNIKKHIRETFVYFIPSIAVSVYTVLDKVMLGILTDGNYENGYYEQASKLVNMAKSIVLSLNTVMYTRMSFLFKENRFDEMKMRLHKSIVVIVALSVPISAGIMAVAKTFIPLFYGEGYDKVVTILYIYMPLVLVIGLSNCLGQQYLTPAGMRVQSNKVVVAGAVVNFVLNAILIPITGSFGATIASVIAETLILALYAKMCVHILDFRKILILLCKHLSAATIMFLVVYNMNGIMDSDILNLFIQVVVGAIVYVSVIILTKDESVAIVRDSVFSIIKRGH